MMARVAKPCTACGEVKPLTDFSPHPQLRDGRQSQCKECKRNYIRRRRAEDPEWAAHQSRLNYTRLRAELNWYRENYPQQGTPWEVSE